MHPRRQVVIPQDLRDFSRDDLSIYHELDPLLRLSGLASKWSWMLLGQSNVVGAGRQPCAARSHGNRDLDGCQDIGVGGRAPGIAPRGSTPR
jgi:hypothetical protein